METLTSYVCADKDCMKVFVALREYTQHKNTHEKPWKCTTPCCEKSFGLRSDRDRHVRCKHQIGNAKFVCSFEGCEFRATRKDNLMQHRRKRHGMLTKLAKDKIHAQEMIDCSTLMRAANTGRIDVIQLCLLSGLSINLKTDDGFTALHCAARTNQVETLKYLLRHGADTNAYSDMSVPTLPVHEAISGRSLECFQLLLEAKTELKSRDGTLKDLLHCITVTGDPRIAQCLLESKHSDVEVSFTINALTLAAAGYGQVAIVESLIRAHPEEVRVATNSHQSPLYLAAKRGHKTVVESLLNLFESRKIHDKALGSMKTTSLRAAAKRGHVDVAKLLFDPHSDSFASIMQVAIENGQLSIVKLLTEGVGHKDMIYPVAASCLFWKKSVHNGALEQAVMVGHVDIVKYLASVRRYDPDDAMDRLLTWAIVHREWASVEAILQSSNGDIDFELGNFGSAALHQAAKRGNILVMKLLLQHNSIDVNAVEGEEKRLTALDLAMMSGSLEVTMLLLRHARLDVNQVTIGETPLHRAMKRTSPEVLSLLLQHPAIDVNMRSDEGDTALNLVLRTTVAEASDRSLQDKLAQLLISHRNFDPSAWNNSSGTLFGTLEKYGYWSSFELLMSRENIKAPSDLWFSDPRAMQILLRQCGRPASRTMRLSPRRLLEDRIISVDAQTPDHKTLLHHAAENNEIELMQLLLSHEDLDPKQKYLSYDFGYNEGHQTPMGIARTWGHAKIVDLLVKHGTMYT